MRPFLRLVGVVFLSAALLLAQAPRPQGKQQPVPPPRRASEDIPIFRGGVTEVTVPVTVTAGDGDYVVDLKPEDFTLYDNDARQAIKVELTEMPVSLVVAIGNSARIEQSLPQIRKIGILFTDLVVGQRGEAAVVTFDHRVDVAQDFTRDSDLLQKAFKDLKAGSDQSRLSDALVHALTMLSRRPEGRRRVIVVIGEDRDFGSETDQGYVLRQAQIGGVSIYAVTVSKLKSALTAPPAAPAPSRFPPGAVPLPPGTPPTPTAEMQARGGVNLLAVILQAASGLKGIIFDRPLETYAKGTGAAHLSAFKNRAIEDAVSRIARELSSQYMVTYRPNNLNQAGLHTIKVTVNRPGTTVRTRPGYYFPGLGAAEADAPAAEASRK